MGSEFYKNNSYPFSCNKVYMRIPDDFIADRAEEYLNITEEIGFDKSFFEYLTFCWNLKKQNDKLFEQENFS